MPQLQIAVSKMVFCNGMVLGFTFGEMLSLEVGTDEIVSDASD